MSLPTEIERKFIVKNPADAVQEAMLCSYNIAQGYLTRDPEYVVRVRVQEYQGTLVSKSESTEAFICIKTKSNNLSRNEFEYQIPAEDAVHLLSLTDNISKTRYVIVDKYNQQWEVDFFHGTHEGLVLAEIELVSEDQLVVLPDWVGEEVSTNPKYYNSTM